MFEPIQDLLDSHAQKICYFNNGIYHCVIPLNGGSDIIDIAVDAIAKSALVDIRSVPVISGDYYPFNTRCPVVEFEHLIKMAQNDHEFTLYSNQSN
jgi:hypothetical protein